MKSKKGFTLIELLAVIAVLVIIALITTPMILGVIEKSKKSSFKDSVFSVFDAITYYKIDHEIESLPSEGISVSELNLKNIDQLVSGILKEENQEIRVENISNGIYCANGTKMN